MNDPLNSPLARDFLRLADEELGPKMSESAVAVMITPNEVDPKFAIELGYAIMLDKPIILAVRPGMPVSDHLAKVADEILEVDMKADPREFMERLHAAAQRLM